MDELITALEKLGQIVVGIMLNDGLWTVYAHDPKLAGRKPILSECRDAQDYLILKSLWNKAGTIILFADKDFNKALNGAIQEAKGR